MTETPETTEDTTVDTPADTAADADTVDAPEADAEASNPSREAARYRTQLREVEAERDGLRTRLETMNRLEIERVAGETLSAPVDLWLNSNGVDSYIDTEGNVDLEQVRADAKILVSERPGLRKLAPAVDRTQGHGGNAGKPKASWTTFLKED